jgi:hypothetical protein
MKGKERLRSEGANIIASFLQSVVRMPGSPTKISGHKRWRVLTNTSALATGVSKCVY